MAFRLDRREMTACDNATNRQML
ncbi:protein of unknown function [Burkholderia multivorans]